MEIVAGAPEDDLLALDEAVTGLTAEDPAKAELVKLCYLAGLSIEGAAGALGISAATAKRRWAYARAWLFRAVEGADPTTPCWRILVDSRASRSPVLALSLGPTESRQWEVHDGGEAPEL